METRIRSCVAGLCLGASAAVGGTAIVTAALYVLTVLVARCVSITIINA
jgi:hypothetical protein